MKAKGWMAIALAAVVAGGGTSMLAGAMTEKQDTSVSTNSSVSEETEPAQEITKRLEESKIEIELDEEGGCLQKTEADMPAEQAVNIAVQEIQRVFGPVTAERATGVGLIGSDHNRRLPESCHAYSGIIYAKGKVRFEFLVHSVTGKVISMMKIPDRIDPMQVYTSRYENLGKELKTEQGKKKYSKIATEFIIENLGGKDISQISPIVQVYTGGLYSFRSSWKIVSIGNEFVAGNCTGRVTIDPETNEVFAWDLLVLE